MNELRSARLRLRPLTQAQLRLGLRGRTLLEANLGVTIKPDLATEVIHRALRAKVRKMSRAAVAEPRWFTYWLMVPNGRSVGIGLLGFKGAPDARGEVEIGYGIAPEYEGQGYTTEAVQVLVQWALAQPGCRSVCAVTLPDNLPSQRVLQKVGLCLVQQQDGNLLWRIAKGPAKGVISNGTLE